MAAISSAQSGNWGTGSTWTGGSVPAVGDTVTIALGHTVTIDVFHDDTTFANGLGSLTINGSLVASTAAGSYQLRVNGTAVTFGAAGELVAGSAATTYPVTCRFRMKLLHATQHSLNVGTNNAALKLYSAIPTYTYAKTTALVANGSTVIPLDTDLTTDACWQVGDKVQLVNVGAKAQNTVEYIIQAIGASSITLTVVTSGFTGGLASGSYVVLGTRNVAIEGSGKTSTNQRGITGTPTAAGNVARAEWRNMYYVVNTVNFINFDDCITVSMVNSLVTQAIVNRALFVNHSNVANGVSNINFISCLFAGNANGVASSNTLFCTSCLFVGNNTPINNVTFNQFKACTFNGNGYLIYVYDSIFDTCTFLNNTYGLLYASATLKSCTFASNTNDILPLDRANITCIDCSPTSLNLGSVSSFAAAPNANYIRQISTTAPSDVRTGRSGTVTKITSGLPTGYDAAYQAVISDVQQPMYFDEPLTVDDIDVNLKVSMKQSIALTYLKVQVFKAQNDPLLGGAADYEAVLTPATVGAWEEHTLTISGAGEYTRRVIFATATASASAYVAWAQEPVEVIVEVPVEVPVLVNRVLSASLAQTNLQGTLS